MKERMDVVIVGAGIGGLTAAIYLAAAGLGVRVIEKGLRVGGKAGVQLIDGVEVDTGPTLLTLPEVFTHVFAAAGREFESAVELVQPEPAFLYSFADGTELSLHHDPSRSAAAVERCLSAEAAREFQEYLRRAQGIWEAAAPSFVFAEAPRLRRLAKLGPQRLSRLLHIDAFSSMERSISRLVRHPHLRDVFRRFATYNGSDVRKAPGTLACIAHVELGLGAHGVRGGLHALARALEDAARGVGVEFEFGREVGELVLSGGRVLGVRCRDGGAVDAEAVVLNADAGALSAGLFGSQAQRSHGRRPLSAPSMSAFTGIVRARRRRDRSAHAVFFPRDYLQEFVDVFDRRRVPSQPAVYACALEVAHGRTGWADHEPLFVMVNAPALGAGTEVESDEVVQGRLLRTLVERGHIDGKDELVWWRTPADLAGEFPGSQGALYGAAFHGPWAAFGRADNDEEQIAGLHLASGSVHPGGGVPLAAQSGRRAAEAILRRRRRSA